MTSTTPVAVPAAAKLVSDTLLRVAGGAHLSTRDDGTDVLHLAGGETVPLTAGELAAVELFAIPRTFASGVRAVRARIGGDGDEESGAAALALVSGLFERGILERHGPAAAPEIRRRLGMFGCPSIELADALVGDGCDVAFVGMPYDLGTTGRGGTETGPAYLRNCSRTAFDYIERDGVPRGWWDQRGQRAVLQGVRLRDVSDVQCRPPVRNGPAFDRLYDIERSLLRAGRLPVVLGGDHSISLPAITAAATVYPGLGVIHFDAHSDRNSRDDMGPWRKNCTHGNFMSWVASNPRVASVLQLGVRQLVPDVPVPHPKFEVHTGDSFVAGIDGIAASLPRDRPYYLTFDVDCLDTTFVSQTGTPIPGGLTYEQVITAVKALTAAVDIVAMDVVELMAPREPRDYREGTTVAYVIFEVLAGVFERRQRVKETFRSNGHG